MIGHDPRSLGEPAPVVTPRLLAFYQDGWDDDGTAIGWRTVAWGLVFGDGSAISIPGEPPVCVTLWHSVEDAVAARDATIDNPDPRERHDCGRARRGAEPASAPARIILCRGFFGTSRRHRRSGHVTGDRGDSRSAATEAPKGNLKKTTAIAPALAQIAGAPLVL
jgi:hypothetical protein